VIPRNQALLTVGDQVLALVEHQGQRIQGVLGEHLGAPYDRGDEPDRIEQGADHLSAGGGAGQVGRGGSR
jgi:hypothetical protein